MPPLATKMFAVAILIELIRHRRINKLLISIVCLPFGWVVMLSATTLLWHYNQVQKINFIVLFEYTPLD